MPQKSTMDGIWFNEMADNQLENLTKMLLESDSEGEEEVGRWGESLPGKCPNLNRNREAAAIELHDDYFSADPVYTPEQFSRRFRVSLAVFNRIVTCIAVHDPYFTQRVDCAGQKGFTTVQKATAALRMLAYGCSADSIDEYTRMAESTALKCLDRFCSAVNGCFGEEYLRSPTEDDIKKLLARSAGHGFPGMLGSIDCCKWTWKNCPTAYHGQFQGKEGVPAVTLEAIADDRLWIWHHFFGMPGCANDINVIESSSLSNQIASGVYPPPVEFEIAGEKRSIPYWLADRIYSRWPCFLQTVSEPVTQKEKLLAICQEARRKDAERAFGVLQAKWHIIVRPSQLWKRSAMKEVMKCCIVFVAV